MRSLNLYLMRNLRGDGENETWAPLDEDGPMRGRKGLKIDEKGEEAKEGGTSNMIV